ncbi:MAG: M28 family peptidase [Myxococcales bacterium]
MIRRLLRIAGGVLGLTLSLGGAAFLHYRPRHWRTPGAVAQAGPESAALRADVEAFPPFRSRSRPAALGAMEALVAKRLGDAGWTVARQEVRRDANPHRRRPSDAPATYNLLATRGTETGVRPILLGAHLDSVTASPGADDDGSAVAVLLDLARRLAPAAAARVELCFFDEEEDGLLGSYTFVASLSPADRARIERVFVMDMVGDYDSALHSQVYPPPLAWLAPDRGDFLSAVALTDADAAVSELRAARERAAPALPLEMLEPPRAVARRLPDLWRSDHGSFWEAGIPAVFLTDTGEFRSKRYHTAADVPGALDYAKLALVADMLAAVAGGS